MFPTRGQEAEAMESDPVPERYSEQVKMVENRKKKRKFGF